MNGAIGWAHFQLRGGWKGLLTVAVGYTGIIGAAILLTVQLNANSVSAALAGWKTVLLVIQGALLLLLGAGRIAGAIRADVASRMMESHRLMPVPAASAIAGYIWGSGATALTLAGATFLIGLALCMAGGIAPAVWIAPNLILLLFAIFASVAAAFLGLAVGKAGAGVLVPLLMATFGSQGMVAIILPGMIALITPLAGKTIFTMRTGAAELTWPLIISTGLQAYIGAILYWGAVRRYLRPDRPALGVVPALMLLVGWIGASAAGMVMWESYHPVFVPTEEVKPIVLFLGSLMFAMLLGLVAVANAARQGRSGLAGPGACLGATAIALPLCLVMRGQVEDLMAAAGMTAAVLAAFFLSMRFLLGIVYRNAPGAAVFGLIWILLTGLVPLGYDYGHMLSAEEAGLTWRSTLGAPGALVAIWERSAPVDLTGGIAFQLGLAGLMAVLFYATRRRSRDTSRGGAGQ